MDVPAVRAELGEVGVRQATRAAASVAHEIRTFRARGHERGVRVLDSEVVDRSLPAPRVFISVFFFF